MTETYEYQSIIDDEALKKVGMELMFLTPEKTSHEEGISAVELSKLLGIPTEIVKQKLKILYDKQIVRVIGISPKLWKFDEYNFQRMDEDDEVFRLLCCFDDVDFDRYFQY
ncbi:MAG: hypothetical protein ACI37T_00385 [Candidatus Gastranaerophilaceae bacterium]